MGYLSRPITCVSAYHAIEYPVLRHEEEVMQQYVCKQCGGPLLCVSSTAYESRVDGNTGIVKEPVFKIRDERHTVCSIEKSHHTGWRYDVFGTLIDYPRQELIDDSLDRR